MVLSRRQGTREPVIRYITDKIKFCRRRARPIEDEEIVKYLIDGMARKEHQAAFLTLRSQFLTDYIEEMERLESLTCNSLMTDTVNYSMEWKSEDPSVSLQQEEFSKLRAEVERLNSKLSRGQHRHVPARQPLSIRILRSDGRPDSKDSLNATTVKFTAISQGTIRLVTCIMQVPHHLLLLLLQSPRARETNGPVRS